MSDEQALERRTLGNLRITLPDGAIMGGDEEGVPCHSMIALYRRVGQSTGLSETAILVESEEDAAHLLLGLLQVIGQSMPDVLGAIAEEMEKHGTSRMETLHKVTYDY